MFNQNLEFLALKSRNSFGSSSMSTKLRLVGEYGSHFKGFLDHAGILKTKKLICFTMALSNIHIETRNKITPIIKNNNLNLKAKNKKKSSSRV